MVRHFRSRLNCCSLNEFVILHFIVSFVCVCSCYDWLLIILKGHVQIIRYNPNEHFGRTFLSVLRTTLEVGTPGRGSEICRPVAETSCDVSLYLWEIYIYILYKLWERTDPYQVYLCAVCYIQYCNVEVTVSIYI